MNTAVAHPGPTTACAEERRGSLQMLAGGLLLGTLGVFVEEAGQDPLITVWFRCAFGALALLLWGAATGRLGELRLRGRALAAAVAAGLLVVLNWALFFGAIQRTSIAVATVVFHVQPLWLMALGAWWLREAVSPRRAAAALLALGGLALASGLFDGAALGAASEADYRWGLLMCLGGSFSYAVVTLIVKQRPQADDIRRPPPEGDEQTSGGRAFAHQAKAVSSFALAWWQCLVGMLVLLAWPLSQGWPAAGPAWAWLAGLGVIHTGLAYVVLYAGMGRLSTGRIAVLQFVYPAAAVLFDWLVYGRALSAIQLAGVVLMAGALCSVRRGA